jgi:hypothetical protein
MKTDAFEVKRRMPRVRLQQLELLAGKLLNRFWQLAEIPPEAL